VTTATSDTTLEAERYLKEVAPHLAGLPAEERADLLDDLAQHLREIAAEPGPPLVERLGSPQAYAAELLASAGVVPVRRPGVPLVARAADLVDRARTSSLGEEYVRLLSPVLRPAWWVFRAYLAVSVLAALLGESSSAFPLPKLAGNTAIGLLAVVAAIPLSVRLGQSDRRGGARLVLLGANVALALYGISVVTGSGPAEVQYMETSGPATAADWGCLATASGEPITNIYAYDADGRLLDPVLLYDQDGQPIDNLCPQVDGRGRRLATEYRQDVNGAPVINAFPRRQTATAEPGPGRPGAPVPVRPPAVVVPRLAPPATTTTAPPG
jgi:hypothetical protein